jgi:hypothetical protein
MNVDERLDRLVERHEALTQSAESLTRDIRDVRGAISDMRGFINDVAQGTARLLRIVEIHEHRIAGHETRVDNLESQ